MTTPSTPDPTPSAALAGIRERYAHTRAPITGNSVTTLFASASDVPSLVAALEAVLALADDWKTGAAATAERVAGHTARGDGHAAAFASGSAETLTDCARTLREAITTGLTGTPQPGEGENHG